VPQYFTQFMNAAAGHGLQYVAEADPMEMEPFEFPEEARHQLDVVSANRLLREQYLDFARARRFRQTILCRAGLDVSPVPIVDRVEPLFAASPTLMPEGGVDLTPEVDVRFEGTRGSTLETHYGVGKAALQALIEAAPARRSVRALEVEARRRAGDPSPWSAEQRAELHEFLLRLHMAGHLTLHATDVPVTNTPSRTPRTHPLARWQAGEGEYVTSLLHAGYSYRDELGRRLLALLVGSREVADLARDLGEESTELVERHLTELARLGFLIE
jgi:hypothetical protein